MNKKISALLIAGLVFAGCSSNNMTFDTTSIEPPENSYPEWGPMIFDATSVKVGDQIGTMTVTSIEPPENSYPEWTPKNDEVAVYFEGDVTLTGSYDYVSEYEIHFYPNTESSKKLPKLNRDTDQSFVTLDDTEENRDTFAPVGSKGTVTVTMNGYIIWSVSNLGVINRSNNTVSIENKQPAK